MPPTAGATIGMPALAASIIETGNPSDELVLGTVDRLRLVVNQHHLICHGPVQHDVRAAEGGATRSSITACNGPVPKWCHSTLPRRSASAHRVDEQLGSLDGHQEEHDATRSTPSLDAATTRGTRDAEPPDHNTIAE